MSKERVGSLIFLFTGIYGFIFSIQLPLGKMNEPGPGVLPLSLSILLCISGTLWLIYGKGGGEEKTKIDLRGLMKKLVTPLQIVMLTAAYILTLDLMGYLLASTLYLFFIFLWVSRYKLWAAMGLAIVIGGGSWYFFEKLLAVQLPRGLWIL
jgi:putative tricarboxylic transport membrane protein